MPQPHPGSIGPKASRPWLRPRTGASTIAFMRIGVLGPVGALLLTALAAWAPERAGNPEPLDPPTCARAPHEADDAASCGR